MPQNTPGSPESRLPRVIALSGAVLVGVLTAIQAQANGLLGAALDDGSVAALISFGSGLAIVAIGSAVLPSGRRGIGALVHTVRTRTIRPWMLMAGFAGALAVTVQSYTVAIIGVATFTVGMVAGQTVSGAVLDRVGYGPAGVVRASLGRIVGSALAVAAVVVTLIAEGTQPGTAGVVDVPWWMLVLPFLAGAAVAWQQATNGRLRNTVGSPLTATLVNFAGGTIALGIAATVRVSILGAPATFPTEPWLYLGGAIGVVYIFLSAALVKHTGVLQLGLGSVVGLLTTSLVIDVFWPVPSGPPLVAAVLSVVIAVVGVLIAVLPPARRR